MCYVKSIFHANNKGEIVADVKKIPFDIRSKVRDFKKLEIWTRENQSFLKANMNSYLNSDALGIFLSKTSKQRFISKTPFAASICPQLYWLERSDTPYTMIPDGKNVHKVKIEVSKQQVRGRLIMFEVVHPMVEMNPGQFRKFRDNVAKHFPFKICVHYGSFKHGHPEVMMFESPGS